jgi:hypothetical protein
MPGVGPAPGAPPTPVTLAAGRQPSPQSPTDPAPTRQAPPRIGQADVDEPAPLAPAGTRCPRRRRRIGPGVVQVDQVAHQPADLEPRPPQPVQRPPLAVLLGQQPLQLDEHLGDGLGGQRTRPGQVLAQRPNLVASPHPALTHHSTVHPFASEGTRLAPPGRDDLATTACRPRAARTTPSSCSSGPRPRPRRRSRWRCATRPPLTLPPRRSEAVSLSTTRNLDIGDAARPVVGAERGHGSPCPLRP